MIDLSRRALGRRGTLWLLGLAVLPATAFAQAPPKRERQVFALDAYEDVKAGRTVLIDTREDYEKVTGAPEGVGASIPYFMDGRQDGPFVADVLRALGGRKEASVTLICQIGIRSEQALRVLERNGFTNAHVVINGFQAWSDFDVPRKPAK